MRNIKAILEQAGTNVEEILKTTIYLADINDFAIVNEVYSSYFTHSYPARSAFEVANLSLSVLIEIEVIAKQ